MDTTLCRKIAAFLLFFLTVPASRAADTPPDVDAGSRVDYLKIVTAYADAMIERGRDVYGEENSPLFAAALNRRTMRPGSEKEFGEVPGVREHDRSLSGANPQEDQALYEVLYQLSEQTGQPRYAQAADEALKFFFTHCQSPTTGLMAWGEHLFWDFYLEGPADRRDRHEICGQWPYWDRCYRFAPDACRRFAVGLWQHQVADHQTGDFSRHADWSKHGPQGGADFPRYAGQMIVTWADALGRSENAGHEECKELPTAVATVLRRMEENIEQTETGRLPAFRGAEHVWPHGNLELARCLWEAAPQMDAELAARMRRFALRLDEKLLTAPHTLDDPRRRGGLVSTMHAQTGDPCRRDMNRPYTKYWMAGYGLQTTAAVANRCYARYRQLVDEQPGLAARYRQLVVEAADGYVEVDLKPEAGFKPVALASAVDLLLNTYELTGNRKYLKRADHFGRASIGLFLDDGLPLPKATNQHDHYEAITGGADLMLALLRLHGQLKDEPAARPAFLEPPQVVTTSPGPEYQAENRKFQGIPSLARGPKGRLWVVWYASRSGGEDQNNYVVAVTSGDDGETWSRPALVIDPDRKGPVRAFDPQVWLDPDGRLWIFWAQAIGHEGTVAGVWAVTTGNPDDPQPRWSGPRRLTDGIMMGKPTVLSDGTWVLPASTWRNTDNSARAVVSTDRGQTWQVRGGCQIPPAMRAFDEHMFVERKDGSLWMLARSNTGSLLESVSTDQGRTWPVARPSAIEHPSARFFIRRLASGNLLLVKHHKTTGRKRLTALISEDDGKTWTGGLLLDERGTISYPDGVQADDGRIFIIYDRNRTQECEILMAVFTEADAAAGKPGEQTRLKVLVNQGKGMGK